MIAAVSYLSTLCEMRSGAAGAHCNFSGKYIYIDYIIPGTYRYTIQVLCFTSSRLTTVLTGDHLLNCMLTPFPIMLTGALAVLALGQSCGQPRA